MQCSAENERNPVQREIDVKTVHTPVSRPYCNLVIPGHTAPYINTSVVLVVVTWPGDERDSVTLVTMGTSQCHD